MPLLFADKIYTPEKWLTGYLLEVSNDGVIQDVRPRTMGEKVEEFRGILSPGFINAHCHVELSGLKSTIDKKMGMTGFIRSLVQQRKLIPEKKLVVAAKKALEHMWNQGIVALGDICNTTHSLEGKKQHSYLYSHNFIELFGLDPLRTERIWEEGVNLANKWTSFPHSITSHAPYSMSSSLIRKINAAQPKLMSIHLLESKEEREWFSKATGPFSDFYQGLNLPEPNNEGQAEIPYLIQEMNRMQSVLWVHLTEIESQEVDWLMKQFPNSYFCLCPRSNRYIHDTSPQLNVFKGWEDRICLGTDSLASNDSLDILAEINVLAKQESSFSFHQLLSFGTYQGAKALKISDKYGQFSPGMRPGINLISCPSGKIDEVRESGQLEKLF